MEVTIETGAIIISVIAIFVVVGIAYFESRNKLMDKLHKIELDLEDKHRQIALSTNNQIHDAQIKDIEKIQLIELELEKLKKDHVQIQPLLKMAESMGMNKSDKTYEEAENVSTQ